MSWAPPKVMIAAGAPTSSGMWTRNQFTRLMQEDATSKQATVAACVATIIASFFLLLLLRPPIVAWKKRKRDTSFANDGCHWLGCIRGYHHVDTDTHRVRERVPGILFFYMC